MGGGGSEKVWTKDILSYFFFMEDLPKSISDPSKIAQGQQCWDNSSQTCVEHATDGDCDDGEIIEVCVGFCP